MGKSIHERPAAGMAWAIDSATRVPVYVGKLTKAQTGLRCGCECPACGAMLQAVNAGANAGQRRVPFFRHHVGKQGPGCKYRVAELAALKLFAEQGVIEIPASRKRAVHVGPSGALYQAEAVGTVVRERIIERRLISDVGVIVTLESGRQVAAVARGYQNVADLGAVFAVIEIQVSDPEVAWLSPDEILSRSELGAQWLHLVSHEADSDLQARADEQAMQKALDQLDVDPESLALPVGATRKQASESLIHWAVKDALMHLGWLQAPELRMLATAVGTGGLAHTVPVILPAVRLEVTNVADEVMFDGYRADIVCRARGPGDLMENSWRLIIEVAVTNRVKPEKLRLIQQANIACIELDVLGFANAGAVTRPQLRGLVANDVSSKLWLHHPAAAGLMAEAQAKVNAARDHADAEHAAGLANEVNQRALIQQRERQDKALTHAKTVWVQSLSPDAALRELRNVLKQRWAGEQERTSNAMSWKAGEFERAASQVLPRQALDGRVIASDGVVAKLEEVIRSGQSPRQPLDVKSVLGVGLATIPFEDEPWLGLLHLAIDESNSLVQAWWAAYNEQRRRVLASLIAGEWKYARETDLDGVIGAMFPQLAEVLAREIGTTKYCKRIKREQDDAWRKAQQEAQEAEVRTLAQRKQKEVDEAADRERKRIPDAIALVAFQWVWRPNLKLPTTAEAAIDNLKFSRHKTVGEDMRALVRQGFAARLNGKDFGAWFASQGFASPEEVTNARDVLEAAWLVQLMTKKNGAT